MPIKFFGHQDSGHAYKVAFALRHFDLDYEYTWIDIWADQSTRPKDFLTASRFAEVPLLIIDGYNLTQSNAILLYLAEKAGINIDPAERELLFWESNRIGMVIPQLIEEKRVKGKGFGEDAVKWLKARYDLDVSRLDQLLQYRRFLCGSDLSIADISIFGYTQWHDKAGLEVPENVMRWLNEIRDLPAYEDAHSLLGNTN